MRRQRRTRPAPFTLSYFLVISWINSLKCREFIDRGAGAYSLRMPDAEELTRIEIAALLAPWDRIVQEARW
jgi:hypothetical protein